MPLNYIISVDKFRQRLASRIQGHAVFLGDAEQVVKLTPQL
jgi:hypothetical protein